MTTFVHVPRTGGLALQMALRGTSVRYGGHESRHSRIDTGVITIVRDPVARFISAFDQYGHNLPGVSIEDLALDPSRGGWFFAPMVTWLDCPCPYLWLGHTETLAEDVERLRILVPDMGPLPRYNESVHRSSLSPEGEASVREWYADDYALLERIR